MSYSTKLGLYLREFHPDATQAYAYQDDAGAVSLMGWLPEYGTKPTKTAVQNWTPSPVPAVQAMLIAREQSAAAKIQALKASCAVALMAGGMSESDTMAAGSKLVLDHAAKIQAYILAGGNPVAGQALIDEIVAAPPAWWSPQMQALFEAELL